MEDNSFIYFDLLPEELIIVIILKLKADRDAFSKVDWRCCSIYTKLIDNIKSGDINPILFFNYKIVRETLQKYDDGALIVLANCANYLDINDFSSIGKNKKISWNRGDNEKDESMMKYILNQEIYIIFYEYINSMDRIVLFKSVNNVYAFMWAQLRMSSGDCSDDDYIYVNYGGSWKELWDVLKSEDHCYKYTKYITEIILSGDAGIHLLYSH